MSRQRRDTALISSEILELIFDRLQQKTDRELSLEFCSEEFSSQVDPMMDNKFNSAVEPLGPTLSSKRSVNRVLSERIRFFGKGLIRQVYKMLLDTVMPVAHQSESQEDLVEIPRVAFELLAKVFRVFCETAVKHLVMELMGLPTILDSGPHFHLVYTDALGSTSRDEMWDSDSNFSSDAGRESSITCLSYDSSIDNEQAQMAIAEVLMTRIQDLLKRTYNDIDKCLLILQKGENSKARNTLQYIPDTAFPEYRDDVSVASDESLMPTDDLLEKTPSLLHEEISFSNTSTIMSPQTLRAIVKVVMCRLYASESPQSRRCPNSSRLMIYVLVEIKHALKRLGISVLFVEASVEFSDMNVLEAIVKDASNMLSLRSYANRDQLYAACHGDKGSICSMANTFTQAVQKHAERYWSSFEDMRDDGSGWSSSSMEEVQEEDQETIPSDNQRWNSAGYRINRWNYEVHQRWNTADSAQCSKSSLSTERMDITSTQKRKLLSTGVSLTLRSILFRKNKVSPICTAGPVAVNEPRKKQSLLKRITAGLGKIFRFQGKK